ncbi:hypothetical protein LRP88_02131 [Fusarium phalaenopsidis]
MAGLHARQTLGISKPDKPDKPATTKIQKQKSHQEGATHHDPDEPDSDGSATKTDATAQVVFCGLADYGNSSTDGFHDIIPIYPSEGRTMGKVLRKLFPKKLQELEDKLGPCLCSDTGPKKVRKRDERSKKNAQKSKKKRKKTEPSDLDDLDDAQAEEVHLHQSVLTML